MSEDKTGNEHPGNGPSDPPESANSAADSSSKGAQETPQQSSGDQAATAEPQTSASTPTGTPPPASAPAAPAPVAAVAAPSRGSSGAIAWLALLLALAVAAGGVWSIMEAQRRESGLLQRVQALESSGGQDTSTFDQMRDNLERKIELELEGLVARQQRAAEDQERALTRMEGLASDAAGAVRREIAGELAALDRAQSAYEARLDRQAERMAEQQQLLSDLSVEDRESWQLAEVQYLIRLANQRLIMTGDTLSAEALLRSADEILSGLDSPELMPLRAAVARDLAAVRAVPRLDTEGLYLRLDALIRQTDELVLFEMPERDSPAPIEASDDWRERLGQGYRAAIEKLSEYIVVSRRDVPIETLMDPQYEGLVRQNMRMLMEQAQVAMLSGNPTLYRQSLERARGWVTQFFKDDAEAAQAMATELAALADERVAVTLPDLSASLQALDEALRQRLDRSRG